MTVIAGLVHGGSVYIGGDSAGIAGYCLDLMPDSKVFRLSPHIVVGFTTSFRMGQIIRYRMDGLKPPEDDLDRWMVVEFIEKLRTVLSEGGFKKRENEQDEGGTFLIGIRDRLFRIEGDFQVGESGYPFNAVGCGADIARGSLASTVDMRDPQARIRLSLEVTESLSAGVRGPFTILDTTQ